MNDWQQKFGNAFLGMILMGFVMAFILLFLGCEDDPVLPPQTEEEPLDDNWILLNPY